MFSESSQGYIVLRWSWDKCLVADTAHSGSLPDTDNLQLQGKQAHRVHQFFVAILYISWRIARVAVQSNLMHALAEGLVYNNGGPHSSSSQYHGRCSCPRALQLRDLFGTASHTKADAPQDAKAQA